METVDPIVLHTDSMPAQFKIFSFKFLSAVPTNLQYAKERRPDAAWHWKRLIDPVSQPFQCLWSPLKTSLTY
ncbi:hypothetical protein PGT21_023360 [Puccinia graminis f. sp. tritici]|uniref:Uncharacterized protein n=1 Tax=Puccinia graminis f. sp. tritici TaxID=56615 RepID=A0A5B0NWD6_PUCGR|nr:hypothetical protein PGT21_023360 [Puccinia graminis f. sp. tritici]